MVRGHVAAALLAVHRHGHVSFDGAEQGLADVIVTLAGVALENAEGLAAVRAALRSRDDFISLLAHELRTPLTALRLRVYRLGRLLDRSAAASEPS